MYVAFLFCLDLIPLLNSFFLSLLFLMDTYWNEGMTQ